MKQLTGLPVRARPSLMSQDGVATRHAAFDSVYRPNFEVVEERKGRRTLYPHTDQLPLLLRALNLEFYNALPGHIARTDRRGDGFHKILIHDAALLFCNGFNAVRSDRLRLYPLLTPDLVAKVSVVQQITETIGTNRLHRFRFYAGPDFFPEIRLSGRRVQFADHVLQRFTERVPNHAGADLSHLLLTFYGTSPLALPVGSGYCLIFSYMGSVLAFPIKADDTEFLITSCLTVNEMHSLQCEYPPPVFNFHYGENFTVPRLRHWSPTQYMLSLHSRWERKAPLPPPVKPSSKEVNWHWVANWVKEGAEKQGHGPGSQFVFLDHIPGPIGIRILPGQAEPRVDEREAYHKMVPGYDWNAIFDRHNERTVAKDLLGPLTEQAPASAGLQGKSTGSQFIDQRAWI